MRIQPEITPPSRLKRLWREAGAVTLPPWVFSTEKDSYCHNIAASSCSAPQHDKRPFDVPVPVSEHSRYFNVDVLVSGNKRRKSLLNADRAAVTSSSSSSLHIVYSVKVMFGARDHRQTKNKMLRRKYCIFFQTAWDLRCNNHSSSASVVRSGAYIDLCFSDKQLLVITLKTFPLSEQ